MMRLNASRSHRARVRPQPRREVLVLPRWAEVLLAKWVRWTTYQDYLHSLVWKSKRERALRRAGYQCQTCPNTTQLNVHHADSDYDFKYGSEDDSRLTVLCRTCHKRIHNIK